MPAARHIFLSALLLLVQASAAYLGFANASRARGLSLLGSGLGVMVLANVTSIAQVLFLANPGNAEDFRRVLGLFSAPPVRPVLRRLDRDRAGDVDARGRSSAKVALVPRAVTAGEPAFREPPLAPEGQHGTRVSRA